MNRRALLTLAGGLIGGAYVVDLATTIDSAPESARLRTGRVVALNGASLTIDLGGGQLVDMPALASYIPVLGDTVLIQQQGPLVVVLGVTTAMPPDNPLRNPSFEDDLPGSGGATGWTFVADPVASSPITPTTKTATQWGAAHGSQWLELASGTVAGDGLVHVISDPIPVTAGQRWTAAAYVTSAGNASNIATLRMAWFTTATGLYPAAHTAETLVNAAEFLPGGVYPQWLILRQNTGAGTGVPTLATYMRVVLSVEIFDVGWVYIDAVTARQLA